MKDKQMSMIDPKGSNPAVLRYTEYDKWLASLNRSASHKISMTKIRRNDSEQDAVSKDFDN